LMFLTREGSAQDERMQGWKTGAYSPE